MLISAYPVFRLQTIRSPFVLIMELENLNLGRSNSNNSNDAKHLMISTAVGLILHMANSPDHHIAYQ